MAFDRILVVIDGSKGGERALAKGLELATLTRADVLALAVEGQLPAYAATVGEVEEVRREKGVFFARLLANARAQAEAVGIELEAEVRPGHAAELIVRVAREWQADLIVLGRKGHFVRDHLLGSTVDRVAEHAECPVMIVKG